MYEYRAVVNRVIDGDTYDVTIDLGFGLHYKTRVRLKDFDAPETWRPRNAAELQHGKECTTAVNRLIFGRTVTLRTHKSGKYGRWLADVRFQNIDNGPVLDLRECLIRAGYAKKESYE